MNQVEHFVPIVVVILGRHGLLVDHGPAALRLGLDDAAQPRDRLVGKRLDPRHEGVDLGVVVGRHRRHGGAAAQQGERDAERDAHQGAGDGRERPLRVHSRIAGLVRVHAHPRGGDGRARQLLAERQRGDHRGLVEGADGVRLEGDPLDRPLASQPAAERLDIALRIGKGPDEPGAALEGVGRGDRAVGGELGGKQTAEPRITDLVAPLVGAVRKGLQDTAGKRGGVREPGGDPFGR